MALTDAERMQMVAIALMKHNVISGGAGAINNFVYMPMVGSYSIDAYFVSDITIAEVTAL